MKELKQAIEAFVIGGDTNDVVLLEKALHPEYQNIQDGFFEEKGIFIFPKTAYLELVGNKTFGGSPRTIHYESIEQSGNIAHVKVILESQHLKFFTTLICVCEKGSWKVIVNIPVVEVKTSSNN